MTLHIVNPSPFDSHALTDCLKHVSEQDSILLIEDAVVAADKSSPVLEQLMAHTVYVLKNDVEARGLQDRVHEHFSLVSDDDFVELTIAHANSMSWY